METARTAALVVAAIGQGFFVTQYARRRWWPHFVGRALFVMSVALLIALALGAAYRVNPGLPGEPQIKTIAFWLLAGAVWWQLVALVRQRRDEATQPKPYFQPDKPESWYWIEHRPSGFWVALEPPEGCTWLLVRQDLELEWFESVEDAAESLQQMIDMDLSIVSATKRQGTR